MAQKKSLKLGDSGTVTVRQVRSQIACMPKTRANMRALGLRKIGDVNTLPDTAAIRGMIARVPHLIEFVAPATKKGA
jgi:large subunit ribosomal protein L30